MQQNNPLKWINKHTLFCNQNNKTNEKVAFLLQIQSKVNYYAGEKSVKKKLRWTIWQNRTVRYVISY